LFWLLFLLSSLALWASSIEFSVHLLLNPCNDGFQSRWNLHLLGTLSWSLVQQRRNVVHESSSLFGHSSIGSFV
jgi:hypothetical protein